MFWEIVIILIIVCCVLWLFGLEHMVEWIITMAILFGILYGMGYIIGMGFKAVTGV